MAMINISNLTFGYEGSYDTIFENVSFTVDTDWKLGLIGRNGCGKTTLLNLLMGKYEYRGSIKSPVPFDYFPFRVEHPNRQSFEMARGIYGELELWELERELSLLRVEEEVLFRPFSSLSNGEQTKVLLAVLFSRQNHFLLIDEPTNHLDCAAREAVCSYLNRKRGFILVSHDRTFLDGCVDHVLSMNRADIEVQRGNFTSWRENRERQDARELAENERLKRDIRRLKESERRTADWSDKVEKTKKGTRTAGLRPDRGHIGHQAAKMMKRSKTTAARREKAVEEKATLLKNIETTDRLFLQPVPHPAHRLVTLKDVEVCYGGRTVCKQVSFSIWAGERIALAGKNGCGKSSILKLVVGEEVPHEGMVMCASGLKISYVPQDTAFLRGGLKTYARECEIEESRFFALLRKLNFERAQFEKSMEQMSGGQKKKVLLARSLCERAHLYVWDEPLNFIDVLSRMQIEELVRGSGAAMLFVEHDSAFVDALATGRVEL